MEINELVDDNENEVVGYWAEGHHSRRYFAEECNICFDWDLKSGFFVQPKEIVKGWLKKQEHRDYDYWVEVCSEDDKDAIAATYFFYD